MYSIAFPNMLSSAKVNLVKDREATKSNLRLLLLSPKYSLLGDPYFGNLLLTYLYEQNNTVLRDIIIDEIYMCITTFMPQLSLTRKDIKITSDKTDIYAQINCINLIDKQPDLYVINLTSE